MSFVGLLWSNIISVCAGDLDAFAVVGFDSLVYFDYFCIYGCSRLILFVYVDYSKL